MPEEVEEAEAIIIGELCYEMKWTFEEFLCQPAWLIDTISMQIQERNRNSSNKL